MPNMHSSSMWPKCHTYPAIIHCTNLNMSFWSQCSCLHICSGSVPFYVLPLPLFKSHSCADACTLQSTHNLSLALHNSVHCTSSLLHTCEHSQFWVAHCIQGHILSHTCTGSHTPFHLHTLSLACYIHHTFAFPFPRVHIPYLAASVTHPCHMHTAHASYKLTVYTSIQSGPHTHPLVASHTAIAVAHPHILMHLCILAYHASTGRFTCMPFTHVHTSMHLCAPLHAFLCIIHWLCLVHTNHLSKKFVRKPHPLCIACTRLPLWPRIHDPNAYATCYFVIDSHLSCTIRPTCTLVPAWFHMHHLTLTSAPLVCLLHSV